MSSHYSDSVPIGWALAPAWYLRRLYRERRWGRGCTKDPKSYQWIPSSAQTAYCVRPCTSWPDSSLTRGVPNRRSFSLEETDTDQTNPTFWGLQNLVLEGVLYGTFSPPQIARYVLPPPLRIPNCTLWHKIITYEKLFWNNYFRKNYESHA